MIVYLQYFSWLWIAFFLSYAAAAITFAFIGLTAKALGVPPALVAASTAITAILTAGYLLY